MNNSTNNKVFDVRRPGRAPASPTSRPVVAKHKPKAQAAQASISGVGARPAMMDPKKKIDIQPLDTAMSQTSTAPNVGWTPHTGIDEVLPADTVPTAPPLPPSSTLQPGAPAPHPAILAKPLAPPLAPQPRPVQAPVVPPAPMPAAQPAPAQLETKPVTTEPFQPVAFGTNPDDPVPTTIAPELDQHPGAVVSQHHTGSAWHVVLLIFIILVLAAAALDILLDAEILKLSGIPHTELL